MRLFGRKLPNGKMVTSVDQLEGMHPMPEGGSLIEDALIFNEQTQEWVEDAVIKDIILQERVFTDKVAKRGEWREWGNKILDEILELNSHKYTTGLLSLQDLKNMAKDADLKDIKDALQIGDLKAAKSLVAAYAGPYYTTQEKTKIIAMIAFKGV